jgi:hypothetical protein
MKHLKTPQELNEASENLNISDVSDSDLIGEIKKQKDNLLIDLENKLGGDIIPDSFFRLSDLIDRLYWDENPI